MNNHIIVNSIIWYFKPQHCSYCDEYKAFFAVFNNTQRQGVSVDCIDCIDFSYKVFDKDIKCSIAACNNASLINNLCIDHYPVIKINNTN